MKKNENETLQVEYPEVKQMTFNHKGYDYEMYNTYGTLCRIEYKVRIKTRKFDITEYQAGHCDIFALRDENGELWFMLNKLYMSLCVKHSAWPKHQSKRWQVSLNEFRKNASKDLHKIANMVEADYGQLNVA